jgi:AraC-like DNA-binding protein
LRGGDDRSGDLFSYVDLTRWRMQLAMTWLEARETSITEAAVRLGYKSEATFKRAFRRYAVMSPGQVPVRIGRSRRPSQEIDQRSRRVRSSL